MSQECCTANKNSMILACSGASNLGQIANQTAVELTREGFGKMFCLAGIGAHLSGFVTSARDVPNMIAIDGCSVGCTKKLLEHAEIPLKDYLVISDLGIEKATNTDLTRAEIEMAKAAVRDSIRPDREDSEAGTTRAAVCGR